MPTTTAPVGWPISGFSVPPQVSRSAFERLDLLDADVLVAEGVAAETEQDPLFQSITAVEGGRLVQLGALDQDFAAALGFNSPLSMPFLLDIAVPRLAAASDDDPATVPEPYGE